jgi:phage portal protein BeeE
VSALTTISNAFRSRQDAIPSQVAMATFREKGRVAKSNAQLYRHWSEHSEWVRAAINIRKGQVSKADWEIVQADPDGPAPDIGLKNEIRDRLLFANPKAESWRTFIEAVVEDILVLDAGSIEIERNFRGEPLYLHGVDGATIRVNSLWDGEPDEARYFWYPDNFERASWKNSEFIYIMETPRTNSPLGLSKLETLKLAIDSELEGSSYNARNLRNPMPDGLLHLGEGVPPEKVDAFKAFMAAEVYGLGSVAVTGGGKNPSFTKFHDSNRDMQYMEFMVYLIKKIAVVFGMHSSDLDFGQDVNRSTAETQDTQTEDRGLRTLTDLIEAHITREYVWDEGFGGQANNLKFKFTNLNLAESLKLAQYYKLALAGMPWESVNTALKAMGKQPLGPEFDHLMMVTPQGAIDLTDIPTGREFLDAKKPPEPQPQVGDGKPKPPQIGNGKPSGG